MKICYVPKKFNEEHQLVIDRANAVIFQFQSQGFTLSLRQVYYQMIAKDLFPNTWISKEGTKNNVQNYKRLGNIISDARRAGLIDWYSIEDRTRNLKKTPTWENPAQIIGICAKQFDVDMWENQDYYVEVFVEKDALVGVIEVACEPHQVPYFSCRGYTSDSEIWAAAQRMKDAENRGKIPIILHLGGHDPSGKDMTRDITDRINLFGRLDDSIDVRRLALNYNQIEQYNPPPNPSKTIGSSVRKISGGIR